MIRLGQPKDRQRVGSTVDPLSVWGLRPRESK